MDETIDNTQERLKADEFKLGWLAAMVDGEGCLTFTLQKDRKPDSYYPIPFACISGTNTDSIQRTVDYLNHFNVPNYVFTSTPKGTKSKLAGEAYKDCMTIRIWGMRRVNKFLSFITPYLIEKKPQAEIMLRFARDRIKRYDRMMKNRGEFGQLERKEHTADQFLDYWRVRNLNSPKGRKLSKSSESIRRATYEQCKKEGKLKMYSELLGDQEK